MAGNCGRPLLLLRRIELISEGIVLMLPFTRCVGTEARDCGRPSILLRLFVRIELGES